MEFLVSNLTHRRRAAVTRVAVYSSTLLKTVTVLLSFSLCLTIQIVIITSGHRTSTDGPTAIGKRLGDVSVLIVY